MSKKSYFILSFALLLYAIYFVWISFQFPYIIDDFYYRYIYIHQYGERIESIPDIVTSQIWHYQYINGRSLIHFLLQLVFLITENKFIINFLNTIVWIALAHTIVITTTNKQNRNLTYWLIAIIGLRFALPAGYIIPYWIAGNFNYYWTSLYALLVLNIYQNNTKDARPIYYPVYIIASFIMGWSHESLAIGVSLALLSDIFIRKDRTRLHIFMCIACCIGCTIMILAPGNFRRFPVEEITITNTLIQSASIFLQARLFYVVILLLLYHLFKNKVEALQFIKKQRIYIAAMAGNMAFCAFIGAGERAMFFAELFAFIVIMSYISTFYNKYITHRLGIVLLPLFIVYECIFAHDWKEFYNEVNTAYKKFETTTGDYVVSKDIKPSFLTSPYIETSDERWKFYEYRSLTYIHKRDFRILPQSAYDAIISGNLFVASNRLGGELPFYTTDSINWLIMPCDTIPPSGRYTYALYPASLQDPDLSLTGKLRRIIMPQSLSTTFTDVKNYSTDASKPFLIDGKYYIILKKPPFQRTKEVIFYPSEVAPLQ